MTNPSLRWTLASVALVAAGCSSFSNNNKSIDYRSGTTRSPAATLEIPPELTSPSQDDRYAIPDPKAQTSFSTYNRDRGAQPAATTAAASGVLPKVENVRMERVGDQRWLVVKGEPDKMWPALKDFWIETGFTLQRESPEVGILETDWAENRARVPQDIVRRTVGRVFDGLWSTSERDKFRTRLEKGTEPGTTEIYVSHRGMQEIYTSQMQERTVWQPRAADRELEAEMLGRIAVKLGFDDKKVMATAGTPGVRPAGAAAALASNAVLTNAGAGPLVVNDGFDRAWRRVGLALDRVGFTVEDRDRSKGLFFVRYVDPDADLPAAKDGWLSKLAFWRSSAKSTAPQYRIHVTDGGPALTNVEVQNVEGKAESSSTGKKILTLLYDQLK